MVRASKEAHAHTKGVVDVGAFLRLWWCRLCMEHACTVPRAKKTQGECVWITPGVAFQHRLAVYLSSTRVIGHCVCSDPFLFCVKCVFLCWERPMCERKEGACGMCVSSSTG